MWNLPSKNKRIYSYNEIWGPKKKRLLSQEGLKIIEITTPKGLLPQDLNLLQNQKALTRLFLDGILVNEINFSSLIQCISTCPLKSLCLANISLNSNHLKQLLDALMHHPTLTDLSLNAMQLKDDHLDFLDQLMSQKIVPLEKLDLKLNDFTLKGKERLENCVLDGYHLTEFKLDRTVDPELTHHLSINVKARSVYEKSEILIKRLNQKLESKDKNEFFSQEELRTFERCLTKNLEWLNRKQPNSTVLNNLKIKTYSALALANLRRGNFDRGQDLLTLIEKLPQRNGMYLSLLVRMKASKHGFLRQFTKSQKDSLKHKRRQADGKSTGIDNKKTKWTL